MGFTGEKLRNKLVPGGSASSESSDAVVSALEEYIDSSEQVKYRLTGKGGVVRDDGELSETIQEPADGQSVAVVTGRQVLIVLASPGKQIVIPLVYTNIKSVDATDGLLRSKLSIAVWGDGEYRFKIADGDDLGAAVHYIREASECWQRVVSALEDAQEAIDAMGAKLEAGELDSAQEARQRTQEKLQRAEQYLGNADIDPPESLTQQIEETKTERDQSEIRNRLARAETLMTEAQHQTESRAYTGAYQSYWYARDHLETALMIARDSDIPEPSLVDSKLETIETRLRHLEVRPLALARQACERAKGTDKLTVRVESWQEAFEHYRDALTAGWGTDLEFEGDREEIRFRIESIVEHLIDSRRELARTYEEAGDNLQSDSEASTEYERALSEIDQARQLAAEFRAGNCEEIEMQRHRLERKRHDRR